ncbi:LssY C-terminal domain-containing protein [Arthrobacter sp. UYCu712]|uniref:LssY C-terminal domain-containing protein n=1 Tax=Arthrobacter sp. UYCu712 TaxID=3156340 RepID=UPI0033948BEC
MDWLTAGTYDRSVGFSLFTLQITHKIDENTDTERDHIVSSIVKTDPAAKVEVLRDFSTGYHTRNGGGDTITTDGDLPIVDLGLITAALGPAQHSPSDSRNKRPAPTIVGALLAGARAVAAIVAVVSGFLSPDDLLQGVSIQSDDGLGLTRLRSSSTRDCASLASLASLPSANFCWPGSSSLAATGPASPPWP